MIDNLKTGRPTKNFKAIFMFFGQSTVKCMHYALEKEVPNLIYNVTHKHADFSAVPP